MTDPRCGQADLARLLHLTGRRTMYIVGIVIALVLILFILCAIAGGFRGRGV